METRTNFKLMSTINSSTIVEQIGSKRKSDDVSPEKLSRRPFDAARAKRKTSPLRKSPSGDSICTDVKENANSPDITSELCDGKTLPGDVQETSPAEFSVQKVGGQAKPVTSGMGESGNGSANNAGGFLVLEDAVRLRQLDFNSITLFKTYIEQMVDKKAVVNRNQLINRELEDIIGMTIQCQFGDTIDMVGNWKEWDDEMFFKRLLLCFPGEGLHSSGTIEDQIKALKLSYDLYEPQKIHQWIIALTQLFEKFNISEVDSNARAVSLVKLMTEKIGSSTPAHARLRDLMKSGDSVPSTFVSFKSKLISVTMNMRDTCLKAKLCGLVDPVGNNNKTAQRLANLGSKSGSLASKPSQGENGYHGVCYGCGRRQHKKLSCQLAKHPDFNQSTKAWDESVPGKAWSVKGQTVLPWAMTLSGQPWAHPTKPDKKRGNDNIDYISLLHTSTFLNDYTITDATIPCEITLNNNVYNVYALFDTGALQDNYINKTVATWLTSQGALTCGCRKLVCSAFSNVCQTVVGKLSFMLTFFNQLKKENEQLEISASIIDSPYELIIGRPSIRQYNLLSKVDSMFNHESQTMRLSGVPGPVSPMMTTQLIALREVKRKHVSELLDFEKDNDGDVEQGYTDAPWEIPINQQLDDSLPTEIFGTEKLKKEVQLLCSEYQDIFSTSVRAEPADIPPMDIQVDRMKWQMPSNRRPPRLQSTMKQSEVLRQVEHMNSHNVTRPSQAAEHSQVLLTPKPNNAWRFCVDYRSLNDISELTGWPIPNITLMLQRLGSHKAKYYAIMDLTSGYHQAPLSESARALTAFITFMGVYEWLRVPMGLKGAPSYFQRVMATIVLAGLLYYICEVYMDDIIVHATTELEFVGRLRQVFERFRKHKLTVNPKKCKFGLATVEYVGHLIDEHGLSFSQKKREEVFNYPQPMHMQGLKQFLGLANYFRDHIRDHSMIVRPLGNLVKDYERKKKLQWTDESIEAFNRIKKEINDCPTLYFMDEHAPVYLHTDASDYGIGAYLFQVVDGTERPTAFLSKSLSREQLRWSTPEKEAFAIYSACLKFEHLIRDVQFTLKTDHKNLIYLNTDGSPKVKRWKLAIQEFDFHIEYIEGPKNIVADAFSRLIPMSDPEETLCLLDEFKIPHNLYKIISKVHNSVAGHHGVQRTINKLETQGQSWQFMKEHVKRFIKQCPCCQKMSYIKVPIHTHPFTTAAYEPMERINVDSIGPLPPDEYGNAYILVIRDCFTRVVELSATKSASAVEAAKPLLAHFGRYGAASQILSDNGSQFVNDLIAELLRLVGTEHVLTIAYSKEENGIVERANKEVMRHLRDIIFHKNIIRDWSDSLPIVQRIMNATVHESIGVSPAQLLFGNAITLDRGIFLPHQKSGESAEIKLSAWAAKMIHLQAEIIEVAQVTQKKKDAAHIGNHPAERTVFPINSYVLIAYPPSAMTRAAPTKFHSISKGPFRVVNIVGSRYTVQNLVTNKNEDYHVTQLRPFVFDPEITNPLVVASKDGQHFIVESIIAHRGSPKKKTEMFFLVRWKGYDATRDSWEPWKELRSTTALHRYLIERKMKSILPKGYEIDDQ